MNLTGIHTLDDLRQRCHVDDNGCWLWGFSVTHDGQPKVHAIIDGERICTTGGRISWLLSGGKLPAKHVVYRYRCEAKLCLNPGHLRCGTKAEAGAQLVRIGRLRGDPARSIINRRNRCSKNIVLDLVKAREIRASDEPIKTLAARYGTSNSTIHDVLTGKRWREPGWSVFSRWAA